MSKKRYRPDEIIGKLHEADVLISKGKLVSRSVLTMGTGSSGCEPDSYSAYWASGFSRTTK